VTRPLPRCHRFVLLAVVAIALVGCSTTSPAATVGGAEISHERVQTDMVLFAFLSGLSGSPCGAPTPGESSDAACARFTLTNEIQEEMVKAYAASHDLSVPEREVSDAIEQLQQSLGGPAQLSTRLGEEGLTQEDLRSLATRILLFGEVQNAVVAERLDEEELRAAYQEARPQFTTVEVHHILLEGRNEAEAVADEATPENFARLARTRSEDPGSAESGGNLGSFSQSQFQSQFDPEFVDAALALRAGQISRVVHTQFGFHVIYVARRDTASFEDVRDQLSAQQATGLFSEWLREQYEALEVDVNPRYGRLDPETLQVVPIRSTEDDPSGPTSAQPSPVP
jgi:foldase protein PrsA